jgi:hypothetical protein
MRFLGFLDPCDALAVVVRLEPRCSEVVESAQGLPRPRTPPRGRPSFPLGRIRRLDLGDNVVRGNTTSTTGTITPSARPRESSAPAGGL